MNRIIGILTLAYSCCFSDITKGELFGFKLGGQYPIADSTKGSVLIFGTLDLVTEKPTKGPDIEDVHVIVTPKTSTIGNIYSVNKFRDSSSALVFAKKYAELLTAKYPQIKPNSGYLNEYLYVEIGKNYQLTIAIYRDIHFGFDADIGLKYQYRSTGQETFEKLAEAEYNILLLESKKEIHKKADKLGLNRGL